MGGLLDYLARETRCTYLSELREKRLLHAVKRTVTALDPAAFPLRDWTDAAHYITGCDGSFASAEEARQCILAFGG